MKKKLIILISSLVLFIIILAICIFNIPKELKVTYNIYGSPLALTEKTNSDYEEIFYQDTIGWSTAAVTGKFKGFYKETEERGVWEFKCEKVIFGKVHSDTIKITSLFSEGKITINTFKEGERYLLFLNLDNSVFYDEARYTLAGNLCMSLDNIGKSTWSKGSVTFASSTNAEDIINYYENMAKSRGYLDNRFEKKVFRNESLETVIKNCDCVFKVKALSKMLDGRLSDSSTYFVEIKESLKGGEYILEDADDYLLHVEKNAFEIGKEYIVALSLISDEDEKFTSFVQASLNGIIPSSDTDTLNSIKSWLSE